MPCHTRPTSTPLPPISPWPLASTALVSPHQVLASASLDRADYPFAQLVLHPAMPATALALHTDGCISVWQRRTAPAAAAAATVAATASSGSLTPAVSRQPTPFTPGAAEATPRAAKRHGAVSFVFRSMLRLLRGEGLALCAFGAAHPPTPDGFAGLTVDGRLWLWSLPPGAAAATAASAHCWPDEWQLDVPVLTRSVRGCRTIWCVWRATGRRWRRCTVAWRRRSIHPRASMLRSWR